MIKYRELKERLKKSVMEDNVYAEYANRHKDVIKKKYPDMVVRSKQEAIAFLIEKDIKELFGIVCKADELFKSPILKGFRETRLIAFTNEEKEEIGKQYSTSEKVWEKYNGFGQYTCCYSTIDSRHDMNCKINNNRYCVEIEGSEEYLELNVLDLYELVKKVSYNQALTELCRLYNIQIEYISKQLNTCKVNMQVLSDYQLLEGNYPALWKLLIEGHGKKLLKFYSIYLQRVWNGKGNGIFISAKDIATSASSGRSTVQTILKAFLAVELIQVDHIETNNMQETYYYYRVEEYNLDNLSKIDGICENALNRIRDLKKQNPSNKRLYNVSTMTKETCREIFSEDIANKIYTT